MLLTDDLFLFRQNELNRMANVSNFAKIGLTSRAFEDYELAEDVLDAILRAFTGSQKTDSEHEQIMRCLSHHNFVNHPA